MRLGTISRSYERYPQNDFSGRNGLVGLEWRLTPRMRVTGTLRYDVEPAQDSCRAMSRSSAWALA